MATTRNNHSKIHFLMALLSLALLSQTLPAQEKSEQLYPVKVKGKWGYINRQGKIVIEPRFEIVNEFSEGLAKVGKVIEPIKPYSAPLPRSIYGYIDQTGAIVIKLQFEFAEDFSEGLAKVSINSKWGFIDKTGKIVIEPKFEHASSYSEGLAAACENKKCGFIDKTGNYAIEPKFDYRSGSQWSASAFSEGLAKVYINMKVCYIDKNGKIAIKTESNYAQDFSEGLAAIWIGKAVGFIDKNGEMVIKLQFVEARGFHEGMAFVRVGKKWGYIDKTGNMVIKPQYNYYSNYDLDFSEGLASVHGENGVVFINKRGEMAFDRYFGGARKFQDGIAMVRVPYPKNIVVRNFRDIASAMEQWFLGENTHIFPSGGIGYIKKDGSYLWKPRN